MTADDIIRMARESGGLPDPMVFIGAYERFANLVAAHKAEVALAEAYRCGYEAGVVAEAYRCGYEAGVVAERHAATRRAIVRAAAEIGRNRNDNTT